MSLPLHLLGSVVVTLTLRCDNAAGHGNSDSLHKKSTRNMRRSRSVTDLTAEESRPGLPPRLVRSNSMPSARRKRADRWASNSKLNNRWENNCEETRLSAQSVPTKRKMGGDAPPVLPRGDAPLVLPRGGDAVACNARMPVRTLPSSLNDAAFSRVF